MTDRPLTTGEGNTVPDWAYDAKVDELRALEAECGRLREREEQLSGWYNRAEQHISELKAEAGRLREQLDAARQALDLVDAPYPLDVFPERTPEQRDAIFAAMRAVDPHATEWFYAHVARERGRVARAALGVEGPAAGDGQPEAET